MKKISLERLLPAFVLVLLFGSFVSAEAQKMTPVILADNELTRVVPTSFYFQGQSAPTQMRNAVAVRFAPDKFVIVGLVDTSGYSTEIKGKYEGFLITDSDISIGGSELKTGAYGFGFTSDGKINIFDVGGKQILSAATRNDKNLKRPRPLAMIKAADEIRLYNGRNYAVISTK